MAESIVDDDLWEGFHVAVNMTSRELREWLMVEGAGEATEVEPEHAGPSLGHRVADTLAKRRADLTPDDVEVMQQVVEVVDRERGPDFEPVAGDDTWRRGLMDIGHDPLKPV